MEEITMDLRLLVDLQMGTFGVCQRRFGDV